MGLLLFGNVTDMVWLEQCPQLFQGEYMCISSESVLGVVYGLTIVWECYRHGQYPSSKAGKWQKQLGKGSLHCMNKMLSLFLIAFFKLAEICLL